MSTGFEFVTARDIIQKIKAIILNLIKSVRVLHESDEPAEHASSDNLPAPESKTQKD